MNQKHDESDQDPAASSKLTREDMLDVLRNVIDPDLQMNIVDLGLVYEVEHLDDGRVAVKMTLTTPHCPYGPALIAEVKAMLMMVRGVAGVQVDLVWDPPWGTDRLTEEGRLALGLDI
ncbi:MAG: putative 1,2-phenylacetyl-CoA epoxidase, subunit D [Verrucomicrobia bacterium ADurb.Bin345]|nr:MAG: putative 1,2-phenylacetyl-CoA epoxidase, subunit D [Verrucomicrobia bacterium ADurb.Bin345]